MVTQTQYDRILGALLGGAIGDALGSPLEGLTPERIAHKYGEVIDYQKLWGPTGSVTDDTDLTLIIADSLIAQKGFDVYDVAQRFVEWLPHADGYGMGTQGGIINLMQGVDPKESGGDSPGNGGAMRVGGLALLYSHCEGLLYHSTVASVKITHNNNHAISASLAVAFGLAYIMEADEPFSIDEMLSLCCEIGGESEELADQITFVRQNLNMDPSEMAKQVGTSGYALHSIPFALYCFARNPTDVEDVICVAANAGGDTDTNASIAGQFAGCYNGIGAIPKRWIDGLLCREKVEKIASDLYQLKKKMMR